MSFSRVKTAWIVAPCALALAVCVLLAADLGHPQPAYAANVDQLGYNYQMAVQGLEDALAEREQNSGEIAAIEEEIVQTEDALEHSQDELGDTAVALYKEAKSQNVLVDIVLQSDSLQDAFARLDAYVRVQQFYSDKVDHLRVEQEQLAERKTQLIARKQEIEQKVFDARKAAELAQAALMAAIHDDGAEYHQVQGNGSNCGATSFIVGVNILLHEKRFTDNVEVWRGAGFNCDSTNNLALRARMWLMANELSDTIAVEEIEGDIHTPEALRAELEEGNVVVISSGPSSIWQHADGTETSPHAHPYGHWIVFYHYEEGVFFANDSSQVAEKGAGCPYTEEQMRQWLAGRSYHSATRMHLKQAAVVQEQ